LPEIDILKERGNLPEPSGNPLQPCVLITLTKTKVEGEAAPDIAKTTADWQKILKKTL